MLPLKVELAKAFHETQSFKWDPVTGFTLASGLKSPFYVDCRSLMAHPGSRRLVANLAYDALRPAELDCLGGLEIGAISIATSISDFAFVAQPPRTWRTFVVRKQAKDHGLGKLIEGSFQPGDRAVIVDDVLTSGGSLLKAVAAARDAGLAVTHALVIVDRKEQDGRRKVETEGLTLVSLLTIDDLTQTQARERFQLTIREQSVIEHLAKGWTNKEIANALQITEQTVKEHIKHIMQKTKSTSRTDILISRRER